MHDHCGKVPYPNPVRAWRSIRTLSSKLALISHKHLYKRNQVYHCPICNYWHLTSRINLKLKRHEPVDPLRTTKRLNVRQLMMLGEAA